VPPLKNPNVLPFTNCSDEQSRPVKLLLIDGHYYAYRSFFAIRGLSNAKGEPTNAIYGFLKTVRRMLKDLRPDSGAIFWDKGLPAHRVALQPEYKQQRAEMPEDMKPQLSFIQNITTLMGFPSIALPDTEADDLIGCYATHASALGHEVIIATNDKDLFQLTGLPGVSVYSTNKTDLASPSDTFAVLGPDAVRKKWGVEPAQIADVLALTGDTADNIPGVQGFGPKTAAGLIREHGSILNLLENLSAVQNEKYREKLAAAKDQILQNLAMVRLDLNIPLPQALDSMQIQPQPRELLDALAPCDFKGIMEEIRSELKPAMLEQSELF